MESDFNPYREWLGLPHTQQPNHYELLGISCAEQDPTKIVQAAERAMSRVRSFRPGSRAQAWARLLDELREAKRILTNSDRRAAYDRHLQQTEISSQRNTPIRTGEDRERNETKHAAAPVFDPRYPPGMGAGAVSGESAGSSKLPGAADAFSGPSDHDAPQFTPVPEERRPAPASTRATPAPAKSLQPPPGVAGTLDPMAPFDRSLLPETPTATENAGQPGDRNSDRVGLAGQLLPPPSEATQSPTYDLEPNATRGPGGDVLPADSSAATPLSIPAEATRALPPSATWKTALRSQQNRHLLVALVAAVLLFTAGGLYIFRSLGDETAKDDAEAPHPDAGPAASIQRERDELPPTDTIEHAASTAPAADRLGESATADSMMSGDVPAAYTDVTDTEVTDIEIAGIEIAGMEVMDTSDKPIDDQAHLTESPGVTAEPSTMGGLAFGLGKADNDSAETRMADTDTQESTDVTIAEEMEAAEDGIDPPTADPPTSEQLQALAAELKAARVALSEMNFTDADRHLQQARALANLAEHQAKVDRLETLAQHVARFHEVLVETVLGLDAGEVVPISASNHVAIVEKSRQHLVIRVAGMNRRYSLRALPLGLAVALADLGLDQSDPMSRVFKGAYVVVHKQASAENLNRARTWWQEAEAGGLDLDDLFEVIDDDYERL